MFLSASRAASSVVSIMILASLLVIGEARVVSPEWKTIDQGAHRSHHVEHSYSNAGPGVKEQATAQKNVLQADDQASQQQASICSLPRNHGRGIASYTRYFYNSTSGLCEEFVYGGCGGNENRFSTIEECYKQCLLPECPPLCSAEYCLSNKTTRTSLCTIPDPLQKDFSCEATCRITNCKICYFDDEIRDLPTGNCTLCDSYPATPLEAQRKCFKQWAICVRRAGGKQYESPQTEERFKCHEHPCL